MKTNTLSQNRQPAATQPGGLTPEQAPGTPRGTGRRKSLGRWLAVAGAVLVVLLVAGAWFLRGTMVWPISAHLKVSFSKGGMAVAASSIPLVNGVYFEISNDSNERHQLTVLNEGVPYRQKGFIEEWQPAHKAAGQTIGPGQSVSCQGIYVYEKPLTPGRRFLVFCNEPGHYGRGEYVELVAK